MTKTELELIINRVAKANNTTPAYVRREIQSAMEIAMSNPDPVIQARWKNIPRKGKTITLEEFIEYVANLASYQ